MNKEFLRAFCERKADNEGAPGDPIRFVASTTGVARDGRSLDASLWNLENFRKNPVFLWAHDYMGRNLPIGRTDITIEKNRLMADVTFDQADEFARTVEGKYRRGYLNAVSVGWFDIVRCANCQGRLDMWSVYGLSYYRKKCPHCETELTEEGVEYEYELLDLSGVPVPGDPDALIEREYRALQALMEPEDSESEWRELAAEMVDLFVPPFEDLEDGDEARLKRYRALLPKYRRMRKTPPEFCSQAELAGLGEGEIRGLFLEGEWELDHPVQIKGRAGAVLNARNRDDLQQAVSLIQGVLERAAKEEPAKDESGEGRSEDDGQSVEFLQALNLRLQLGGLK